MFLFSIGDKAEKLSHTRVVEVGRSTLSSLFPVLSWSI